MNRRLHNFIRYVADKYPIKRNNYFNSEIIKCLHFLFPPSYICTAWPRTHHHFIMPSGRLWANRVRTLLSFIAAARTIYLNATICTSERYTEMSLLRWKGYIRALLPCKSHKEPRERIKRPADTYGESAHALLPSIISPLYSNNFFISELYLFYNFLLEKPIEDYRLSHRCDARIAPKKNESPWREEQRPCSLQVREEEKKERRDPCARYHCLSRCTFSRAGAAFSSRSVNWAAGDS